MMDFSTYDLHYTPDKFFDMFIETGIADLFSIGDPRFIVGMSGVELAYEVLYKLGIETGVKPNFRIECSPEYWAGWALAYYQWDSGQTFQEIIRQVSISKIIQMYNPYHEMDISHFAEAMDGLLARNPKNENERI